jgi:hypothetical protein
MSILLAAERFDVDKVIIPKSSEYHVDAGGLQYYGDVFGTLLCDGARHTTTAPPPHSASHFRNKKHCSEILSLSYTPTYTVSNTNHLTAD